MDKGYMKGRLRIAVALMIAVAAIVALPAMAQAATTASQYPAPSATLHAAPAAVSVDVFGAVVDAKTAKITVAGTQYPADVANTANGGAWNSSEVLVGNVYRTVWAWMPGAAGAKSTLTVYPSGLVAGSVSVAVSAKDTAGNAITDGWSFTLAANGTNPVVPPASAVDNQNCTQCHKPGSVQAGTFAVDYSIDNAMGPNCLECHTGNYAPAHGMGDAASHPLLPKASMDTTNQACVASGCHDEDLVAVHNNGSCWSASCHTNYGTNVGAPVACPCHGAAAGRPTGNLIKNIQNGIAAPGSLQCTSCHDTPNHMGHTPAGYYAPDMRAGEPGYHKAPSSKSAACVSCHGTDIAMVHSKNPALGGNAPGCICHTGFFVAEVNEVGIGNAPDCPICHTDKYAPHGFTGTETHGVNAAVSGHNTTEEGIIGGKTSFPTLEWESEIANASLPATWLVGGQGPVYAPLDSNGNPITSLTVGQVGTLTTKWDLPTQSVFWPADSTEAPSTAVKGLTWNSVITCEDCHTGLIAAGPQGAAASNFGLDTNYPAPYEYAELTKYVTANQAWPTTNSNYNTALSVSGIAMFPGAATAADITTTSVNTVPTGASSALANRTDGTSGATAVICAKCHKLETWIPTSAGGVVLGGGAVEGANTAHDSHHQDQLDGSAQCVNCHIGLPHGWKRPRLLVNTDVDAAPFLSAKALGTTRATSTGVKNTGDSRKASGFGAGFNGQGMQSLSGVDNHTLQSTTLGHQGFASWTEASCQACGDHAGEDGVRIKEAE